MVERNVKLMSTHASPLEKKIAMVLAMALGCDQKNLSIQPARAPISHNESAPIRIPSCVASNAQVGQSLCTGRRRTVLDGAMAAVDGCCAMRSPGTVPAVGVSWALIGCSNGQAA